MGKKNGANAPYKHFELLGLLWQSYPCFDNMAEDECLSIASNLTELTRQGFMRESVNEELANDVRNHVAHAPRLFILKNRADEPKAYICAAISEWEGYSVYELWGIIINPQLQGKSLGLSMLLAEIGELKPELIILRTQNMSMYKLSAKVAFLSEDLAIEMAPTYYPYNLQGRINHGVYQHGGSLYGDQVQFESQAIPFINWKAGDGLVVAGFIKKRYHMV